MRPPPVPPYSSQCALVRDALVNPRQTAGTPTLQQVLRPCSAPSKRGRGGATVANGGSGGGGGGGGGGGAFGRERWTECGATVTASGLFATGRPHSAAQRHPLRSAHSKPWT